jgi:hypothetical protein
MSIEAMKQALEALEEYQAKGAPFMSCDAAVAALRAAIEQADTAPRQWVELTDDEARALVNRVTFGDRTNWQAFVYIVDAKLKEKNA